MLGPTPETVMAESRLRLLLIALSAFSVAFVLSLSFILPLGDALWLLMLRVALVGASTGLGFGALFGSYLGTIVVRLDGGTLTERAVTDLMTQTVRVIDYTLRENLPLAVSKALVHDTLFRPLEGAIRNPSLKTCVRGDGRTVVYDRDNPSTWPCPRFASHHPLYPVYWTSSPDRVEGSGLLVHRADNVLTIVAEIRPCTHGEHRVDGHADDGGLGDFDLGFVGELCSTGGESVSVSPDPQHHEVVLGKIADLLEDGLTSLLKREDS